MNLEALESFFFWWLMVDLGFYLVTVVALLAFRRLAIRMQSKMMGVDERTALAVTYAYIGAFKLLIIVFNVAPWLALVILNGR